MNAQNRPDIGAGGYGKCGLKSGGPWKPEKQGPPEHFGGKNWQPKQVREKDKPIRKKAQQSNRWADGRDLQQDRKKSRKNLQRDYKGRTQKGRPQSRRSGQGNKQSSKTHAARGGGGCN